jgi:hypothetical protein
MSEGCIFIFIVHVLWNSSVTLITFTVTQLTCISLAMSAPRISYSSAYPRHALYDINPSFIPYIPHGFHWHSLPPPPIPHKVWIVDCKSCRTFITNRGMKARPRSPTSSEGYIIIFIQGGFALTSKCVSLLV